MLIKLLKYDLKYMTKNMSIFYILSIVFAITTRILFSLKQTVVVSVISQISVGCMFSMVASILFNTVIRSWIRFRDSIYKDEAYLTHTLPVTKTQIYESRFLQTIIFTLIGFIFSLISIFITYYTEERWLMLKNTFNNLSSDLNINTALFITILIVAFFLEIINAIQSGYLGIILGFKKNNSKVGFSFLFGFIAYNISQITILLIVFITAIFNSNIMNLFKENVVINSGSIWVAVAISIVSYVIAVILMNILSKSLLKKGVNVE